MKFQILLLSFFTIIFFSCQKKYKVKGNVHITGKITDQVSGAPVSNVKFMFYVRKKGSVMSPSYLFHVSSGFTYTIDVNGNYEVNYTTSSTADYGYAIEWFPEDDTTYYHRFDNHYLDDMSPSYCQSRIIKNETVLNISLYRNSFHKARLVDDSPYNTSDTMYFSSAGLRRIIKNYGHDTIVYTTLPPSSTNNYFLQRWSSGKYTTISSDTMYTTNAGDTISTETHY